jgi:hypothetical protein
LSVQNEGTEQIQEIMKYFSSKSTPFLHCEKKVYRAAVFTYMFKKIRDSGRFGTLSLKESKLYQNGELEKNNFIVYALRLIILEYILN